MTPCKSRHIDNYWLSLVGISYAIIVGTGMLHHEMWLDEMHHWLLGRDSASPAALINHARYEGHPLVWNLLLWLVALITDNPIGMQVLHLIIATTTMVVFWRYAPFSIPEKCLFSFGYFPIYEYSILSRNYSLGVLCLFACLILYNNRKRYIIHISLLMIILANTHLWGLILASAFGALLIVDFWNDKISPHTWVALGLYTAGALLALTQIIPPGNHPYQPDYQDFGNWDRLKNTWSVIHQGMLPFPNISDQHIWNSSYLLTHFKGPGLVLSTIFFLFPLYLLRSNKRIGVFYYLGILGILAFIFLTEITAMRYYGPVFLLFISMYWLNRNHNNYLRPAAWILQFILLIQLFAGVYLYVEDWRKPFSAGKATVSFLTESQLDQLPIAVYPYTAGQTISGYLQRPVFYPNTRSFGSYCQWEFQPFSITEDEIIQSMDAFRGDSLIYLGLEKFSSEGISSLSSIGFEANLIQSFTQSRIQHEKFHIYLLSPITLTK